jgi:hypothetical protein
MKTSTAPGGSMTRYRDTATGETYDEDAMEDLLFVDIGNLEAKDASGLTSASSWRCSASAGSRRSRTNSTTRDE